MGGGGGQSAFDRGMAMGMSEDFKSKYMNEFNMGPSLSSVQHNTGAQ